MLYLQMIKFKIHEKDNRFIVWLEKCSPPRPIMVMLNLNFSSDLNVFLFFWARLKPIVFDQIITKDYCSGWELLRKAYKLDKIICWSFVRIFASCSASFFGFEWIFDVQYLNFFFLWQPYLIKIQRWFTFEYIQTLKILPAGFIDHFLYHQKKLNIFRFLYFPD